MSTKPERGPGEPEPQPPSSALSSSRSKSTSTFIIEAAPEPVRQKGVLTVTSGIDAGRVISIPRKEVITLGRAPECTYPFDDVSLSREHAQVMCIGSEYVFKDVGSTNGSYLNDRRVTQPVPLRNGDRLRLGSATTLRFSLVDEAEEAALRRVYEAAVRDGLTGVYNRKHLEERLDAELSFAERHGTGLSVILLDVDHFKRVNDTYGHLAGDQVLITVASVLSQDLRVEDIVGRYGGEEFVILCRGIEAPDAVAVAERLRQRIAQTETLYADQRLQVTASAGVASLACVGASGASGSKAALLGLADKRLYMAKEAGRNRVVGP